MLRTPVRLTAGVRLLWRDTMNFRKCIVLGTICCSFVLTANAVEQADLNSKVAQLNQQSIKLLGVSLNALRYLVEASSTLSLIHI